MSISHVLLRLQGKFPSESIYVSLWINFHPTTMLLTRAALKSECFQVIGALKVTLYSSEAKLSPISSDEARQEDNSRSLTLQKRLSSN